MRFHNVESERKITMSNFSAQSCLLLAEGKTKQIWAVNDELVKIFSKDDITAGDGKKHDILDDKGEFSNQTTCNVFRFLMNCKLPVAFIGQSGGRDFIAQRCKMIPYEVVVRRRAKKGSSFLKRHPELPMGYIFSQLKLEFFLKTSGKKWLDYDLFVDDPLVVFKDGRTLLYRPDQPIHQQTPFLKLDDFPLKGQPDQIDQIGRIAIETFLVLENAFRIQETEFLDLKVEFGYNAGGKLLLADVIDSDSWRLECAGQDISKESYRQGAPLDQVLAKFKLAAELTGRFSLPRQQLVLWRGSDSDDLKLFYEAISENVVGEICSIKSVTLSAHKKPVELCDMAKQLVQEFPESVFLAIAGRSNGLGPVLAGQVSVPVINVPSKLNECREDIYSSLRLPTSVPAATIEDPKNAVLFALQILAMRNPKLYAQLRMKKEEKLCNFVKL